MKLLNDQFFNILNLDKEFTFKLADMFESSTIDLLEKFELALDNQDTQKCQNIMHTAKGGAANFGAESLMNTFHSIEKDVANLNPNNAIEFKQKSEAIKGILDKTISEVQTYR
ncbi:MAG: Hpt domain-containing protein [Proteobacteria bacterium]|nr:Hpt domain-containing protein [Pseudomonadota bacterium]